MTAMPNQCCGLCGKKPLDRYVEGLTKDNKEAIMCMGCHQRWGRGLGALLGALYVWVPQSRREVQFKGRTYNTTVGGYYVSSRESQKGVTNE